MEKKVKIFYNDINSPFLKMTEIWFKYKDIEYEKHDFNLLEENQKRNMQITDNDKFPKILINGVLFNGYSELIKKESYVLFLLNILEDEIK